MDEVIVAEQNPFTAIFAGISAALLLVMPVASWIAGLLAVVVGVLLALRVSRMRLSVNRSEVVVQNFWNTERVPLDEVQIVDERDDVVNSIFVGRLPGDSYRPRALFLKGSDGRKVRIGLAPTMGSRLDQIAEDLYKAIDQMRGSG